MKQAPAYHPHIDGLRALAVIPVILFHLGLGFPGGFVGVDVFFVISGFLISSIIIRQLKDETFSIFDFFKRRIARIAPASLFMMAVVLLAGYWILVPDEYRELGQATIAQVFFAGNLYHAQETGYFGTAAEYRPLLHTWSLAIEEQFYLILPLLAIFLHRWGRRTLTIGLAVCFVSSLLIGIWLTYANPRAGYLFLPGRAWELLSGSLLAILAGKFQLRAATAQIVALTGLALIVTSYFLIDSQSAFPGVLAILPVCGACLLITSDLQEKTAVGAALSLPPILWIGKLSYSLYLWHWPVIVYARYLLFDLDDPLVLLSVALLITALSLLSYALVERPLRGLFTKHARAFSFSCFAGTAGILLLVAGFVHKQQGLPNRLPPEVFAKLEEAIGKPLYLPLPIEVIERGESFQVHKASSPERPRILLFGDSHAEMYFPVFADLGKRHDQNVEALHAWGSIPLPDCWSPYSPTGNEGSLRFKKAAFEFLQNDTPDVLIIAARWDAYTRKDPHTGSMVRVIADENSRSLSITDSERVFEQRLAQLLGFCASLQCPVYLIQPIPTPDFDVPRVHARATLGLAEYKLHIKKRKTILADQAFCRSTFEEIKGESLTLIDPLDRLIDEDGMLLVVDDKGQSLFRDPDHLSPLGARLLSPLFEQAFIVD